MRLLDCPDDLVLRAGRETLSAGEAKALNEHLMACAFCRMSSALTRAVGPLPAVDEGDQALAERLLVAASTEMKARPHPRKARALNLVLLVTLASSGAAAAVWRATTPAPLSPAPASAPASAPARPVALPAADPPAPAIARPVAPSRRRPLATAPPPSPLVPPGAEALFRAANEARQMRDLAGAVALYRRLQADFPRSPEARLSLLSLADLLVARGEAGPAIALYDDYLAGHDAGLAEEALIGKARAFARLRRSLDERAVWEQFLRDHPTSDYRWRAQQRLDELSP